MAKYWFLTLIILLLLLLLFVFFNTTIIQDSLSESPVIPQGLLSGNKIESEECMMSLQLPKDLKISFTEEHQSCHITARKEIQSDVYSFSLEGSVGNWDELVASKPDGEMEEIGNKTVLVIANSAFSDTYKNESLFLHKGDFIYIIQNSYKKDNPVEEQYITTILSSIEFTASDEAYVR